MIIVGIGVIHESKKIKLNSEFNVPQVKKNKISQSVKILSDDPCRIQNNLNLMYLDAGRVKIGITVFLCAHSLKKSSRID